MRVQAEVLNVAVASNFLNTLQTLKLAFERSSEHSLKLSAGSSGKHYAQIKLGAPFDVFLSADSLRPKKLSEQGRALESSRFTYAIGRLVLWGRDSALLNSEAASIVNTNVSRFAIANPRLAPYGVAAQEVLTTLNFYQQLKAKLVTGENINQAYQFVASGNAQLGLVSLAQIKRAGYGDYWLVPSELHTQIEQQAIIINDSKTAREFIDFLQSDQAVQIIQQHGYNIP